MNRQGFRNGASLFAAWKAGDASRQTCGSFVKLTPKKLVRNAMPSILDGRGVGGTVDVHERSHPARVFRERVVGIVPRILHPQERGQLAAGGVPERADSFRIHAVLGGVRTDPAHRTLHVVELRRPTVLRPVRQPVIHRKCHQTRAQKTAPCYTWCSCPDRSSRRHGVQYASVNGVALHLDVHEPAERSWTDGWLCTAAFQARLCGITKRPLHKPGGFSFQPGTRTEQHGCCRALQAAHLRSIQQLRRLYGCRSGHGASVCRATDRSHSRVATATAKPCSLMLSLWRTSFDAGRSAVVSSTASICFTRCGSLT